MRGGAAAWTRRTCTTFLGAKIGAFSEAVPHALVRFGVSVSTAAIPNSESEPVSEPIPHVMVAFWGSL